MEKKMKRRSLLVLIAAAFLGLRPWIREKKDMPTLYGDGQHDDIEALQAFFDGKEVIDYASGNVICRASGDILEHRTFAISGAITIYDLKDFPMRGCHVF